MQAAEHMAKGQAVTPAIVAETAKASAATALQPAHGATPGTTAPAPAAANDQPAGNGEKQPEAAVQTVEPRAQQPSGNPATDIRALIASLTSSTGLAGSSQAGAAQQLGEALAAQVLDLAGGGEWLDQLTREIGRASDTSNPLRFRLTPESLGELKVEIAQSDRGAIVRMTVSTEAAQAAIADAQPRLAAEARAQGVRIAETQVDLAGSQGQQHGRESARQQAAGAEQPLRAFRAAASTSTTTEAPTARSRPADRYA